MRKLTQIEFLDIEENDEYSKIIEKVVKECFEEEDLLKTHLYLSVILTTPNQIQEMNNTYRKINKATDVLSFPMFEKDEIPNIISEIEEPLGDIVISIEKVKEQNEKCFACHVGARNPYGLSSSFRGEKETGEIALYSSEGISYIKKSQVIQGYDTINKYKVMISKVTAEHAGEPDKDGMLGVLSTTKRLEPNEVCTDSYLIAYASDSLTEVNNCIEYMKTKFFRFLLLQAVSSINLSKDKFIFVPDQDYNVVWNDKKLYKKYHLSKSEIDFIENMIKTKSGGDN